MKKKIKKVKIECAVRRKRIEEQKKELSKQPIEIVIDSKGSRKTTAYLSESQKKKTDEKAV